MRLLILLSFVIMAYNSFSQDLKKADDLLEKGDLSEALVIYENIEKQGLANAQMYKNMAGIYQANQNIGYAMLYLEKALKLQSNDPIIQERIDQLKYQNSLPKDINNPNTTQKYLQMLVKFPKHVGWLASMGLLSILSVLFILKYPRKKFSPTEVYPWTFIIFFAFLFALLGFINHFFTPKEMIVLENSQLRISPDRDSEPILELWEGSKVKHTESLGNWIKVKDFYGDEGWLPQEQVREI